MLVVVVFDIRGRVPALSDSSQGGVEQIRLPLKPGNTEESKISRLEISTHASLFAVFCDMGCAAYFVTRGRLVSWRSSDFDDDTALVTPGAGPWLG